LQPLIDTFDFAKFSRGTPKFDTDELDRSNSKIIHQISYDAVKDRLNTLGLSKLDENFWNATNDCYLYGFWQSEKYFGEYANDIRSFFVGSNLFNNENKKVIDQINDPNQIPVSIHIRRGDMVHNPDVKKIHGYCTLEYYLNAANTMMQKFENVRFFVFSDEPEWCKENFKPNAEIVIVDHNQGLDSFNDIRLMAQCHHHIIPNSSFSWWGAWLNSSENKVVIAPKQWFAINDKDTKDLIPSNWIRL
jgi:hypothetical protein